ncbi:YafY family transcriptional regulator [Tetragenococcus koreensis]|uniref:helix-turn-helix transcriptional regulator n=1 Tax=Tetragenococcus koreensis TaxID=290335 RepID=UPI001F41AAB1|nr:YafY family protein [Tetragenococcus koreensis]MCF1617335.1 YafY family transcriptional regulator [Tetragenococcus koreensis]
MMKIDRLLGITMEMLAEKKVTAPELAEKYEVSTRTIYRDMEAISMAGIPVKVSTGINGGFEIMPGYFLTKQYFSLEELSLIYHFLKGMKKSSEVQSLETIVQKLEVLNTDLSDTQEILFHSMASKTESGYLNALHQSIVNSESIHIEYVDSKMNITERNILVYHLIWESGNWYVEAYCQLRENKRYFKVSRIKSIQKTGIIVTDKPSFVEENHAKEDGFYSQLLFKPSLQLLVEESFPNNWTQTEQGISVEVKFYDLEYAVSLILSFGENVKIIQPNFLKQHFLQTIKQIQSNYEENNL